MKPSLLEYVNQTGSIESRLPTIALIFGLTSGPVALMAGKLAGVLCEPAGRFLNQNIAFYSWFAVSLAVGGVSLVSCSTRRFRSLLAIVLTCIWAAVAVSIEWWLLQLPLGPGL
ncbi:MAG TPA: hypothetical protein VG269_27730 [Tepidisphaeraceae bacterium]|nr:hypothetical protein [Tepidisphaeraceae bacterium]